MNNDNKQKKINSSLSIINILIYVLLAITAGLIIYIIMPKKTTSIKNILLENYIAIRVGETHKIKIANDEINTLYTSNNPEIASVSDDGIITGKKTGKAIITVKTNDKEEEFIALIKEVDIENIRLNKDNIKMKVGETITLTVTITPENASDNNIKWTSTNSNIVEVNNGKIIAKASGNAEIIASTNNGKIASCKINVLDNTTPTPTINNILITNIKLNYDNITIVKDESIELKVTYTPENATNKSITWESSNTKVATINNGKVTGKDVGTATITAKTTNGIKANVIINVKNKTYNKTAIFFGDSITLGIDNYSFANYINDHYDLKKVVNAGISGGFVSLYTQERWILNIVKKHANEDYDYVIMQGGVNDTALPMPLGSYNKTDFSGNYDNSTFIGGLETYIYTVKKQWPKAKLGYIIMYKTPNCEDCIKNSNTYYSKIAEVLKKWNINYLNLYSGKTSSGQTFSDLLKVNTDEIIKDGTHINKTGHTLLAPHVYEWMNKLK